MTVPIKALSIANIAVSILLVIGAFVLTELLTSLKNTAEQLRQADISFSNKQIAAIEVLVTGYVTREEFHHEIERLNNRVNDILQQRK